MIIDNHVHIGWYTDRYHAPREVWNSALAARVDGMAVSSTSTCAELYKVVVREMRQLIKLGGERIHPILWLTPKMMKCRYAVPFMLKSKIRWQGIKMHWEAHPEWSGNRLLVNRALNLARRLGVPVLLHTGNFDVCHAGRFARLIEANGDLTFVLAHGRPIEEAIAILKSQNNVFIDTAFMPEADIQRLADERLDGKILFGTDAPINEVFFPETPTADYIKEQIELLQRTCGISADVILSRTIYNLKH